MNQSYVIDGYNLLHAMGGIHGKLAPHRLEKARNGLLDGLAGAFGVESGQVTVVFDAAAAPPGSQAEQEHLGIHVLFAVGGPEADDLIEDLISLHPHPRHLAVVSDDHRLQCAARRRHARPMPCADFLDVLEELASRRRQGPEEPEEPPTDPDEKEVPSQADTNHWLAEFGHLQKELDRFNRVKKLEKLPPAKRVQ